MVNVPAGYQSLLQQMSSATGIPYSVEAAQANQESGFSATAVSNAGAEGWLQFLPSTYQGYATQAGVSPTSEFDPASEAKVYDLYMQSLLQQEHGNLRNALAAYNAGPGNLSAGYGYADTIMAAANVPTNTTTSTTGFTIPNPFSSLTSGLSVSGIVTDAMNAVLKSMGLGSMKDLMERAGLLILGFVLVIVGIRILAGGSGSGSSSSFNTPQGEAQEEAPAEEAPKEAEKTAKKQARRSVEEEAVETAAAA